MDQKRIDSILPDSMRGIKESRAKSAQPGLGQASFHDYLKNSLQEVNQRQHEAEEAQQALLLGQTDKVSEVMTAVKKAEIAFDLMLEVRNKVVEGYNELMRMQI